MRLALALVLSLAASPVSAALLYGALGAQPVTPVSPPTTGAWRQLAFSFTAGNPYGVAGPRDFPGVEARLVATRDGATYDPYAPLAESAAGHTGNGFQLYASTVVARTLLILTHFQFPPTGPAVNLAPIYATLDLPDGAGPLAIVLGEFTAPPGSVVGTLPATVNGAPVALSARIVPEPACWLMAVAPVALVRGKALGAGRWPLVRNKTTN